MWVLVVLINVSSLFPPREYRYQMTSRDECYTSIDSAMVASKREDTVTMFCVPGTLSKW